MGTPTDRTDHPDRRETELEPIVERRGGTERRVPRWIEWTRANDKRGKDLTGRAA